MGSQCFVQTDMEPTRLHVRTDLQVIRTSLEGLQTSLEVIGQDVK